MFGFGFTFGHSVNYANAFIGLGDFFFDPVSNDENTVRIDSWYRMKITS